MSTSQSRDPKQARLLAEDLLQPDPRLTEHHKIYAQEFRAWGKDDPVKAEEWGIGIDPGKTTGVASPEATQLFIAIDPGTLGDAMVETASGIFSLINRDDLPSQTADLIDDWKMDYARKYLPARLAAIRIEQGVRARSSLSQLSRAYNFDSKYEEPLAGDVTQIPVPEAEPGMPWWAVLALAVGGLFVAIAVIAAAMVIYG
jgi:hypothetical protein